ncbi:MAG: aminoacyl-tRNA hydrolase [Planctomycetes bacterium]|nr:aminoacyl-tRNA hydrolase [Planctomycetota bacterium]MBL7007638.1 aminoacyl-tRNA hydrolase [Planctomycetota bacterium]
MIPGSSPGDPPVKETPEPTARLVVGLGNPGPEYQGTRHNVGFGALDLLASRLGAEPAILKVAGQRLGRLYRSPDGRFGLLWPLTYMNLSGGPVARALERLEGEPASLFVLTDDFNLDLGALRARPGGSPGGHNGLKSIEKVLGTSDYARLRIGVGDPGHDSVEFVLSRFKRAEQERVEETLETASFAAEDWIRGATIEQIAARYNRRSP